MANENTEECNIKGKIKLRIEDKIIILTDVYYLKASKNIISLTKFMENDTKSLEKRVISELPRKTRVSFRPQRSKPNMD